MSSPEEIAKLKKAIASIDSKLNLGLTSTTFDGETATFDIDALERRKAVLERQLEACKAANEGRPDQSSYFRPINLPW